MMNVFVYSKIKQNGYKISLLQNKKPYQITETTIIIIYLKGVGKYLLFSK